jgi:hypothetical protein
MKRLIWVTGLGVVAAGLALAGDAAAGKAAYAKPSSLQVPARFRPHRWT